MAKDDDWAPSQMDDEPKGTLARSAYGYRLTVTPTNPKRPKGASIWMVHTGGWGRLQGEVPSQRGAKTAAMHVAKSQMAAEKKAKRQMAAEEKPKAGKAKAPKGKPAKPAKTAKPTKPTKAAKPAKAKAGRAPRKGSVRQHVEDLRQRTARLLADMPARSS